KVHKDFKVIFVDTEVQEGRDKLARFFHWAPKGAFFVVDEVQRIFKPKWTAKDIALLAYQGGAAAKDDDRPEDFDTAWDMQRHHNWDFVFTTTSITKVRSEMRDMAKVAVRHYNLGIWRFYKTVEHASDNKGTTASQQSAIRYFNWVPKKVFALYSSTKTGTFTNSEPKTPVYRDPKIIGLLSFLVIFWTYLLGKPAPIKARDANADSSQQVKNDTKQVSDKTDEMATKGNSSSDSDTNNNDVSNVKHYKMGAIEPFIKVTTITGSVFSGVNSHYMF
ncbi:MAG: hypothetical protein GY928_17245, partial [Colwellia sp.]|nr:hypothetical protein [Colwellia sp.]